MRASFTPGTRVNRKIIRAADCGFLATIVMLLINSLLLVSLLVLWSMGVERVALNKPIMLISLLGAGVVTDVVILWLMPPLAK